MGIYDTPTDDPRKYSYKTKHGKIWRCKLYEGWERVNKCIMKDGDCRHCVLASHTEPNSGD